MKQKIRKQILVAMAVGMIQSAQANQQSSMTNEAPQPLQSGRTVNLRVSPLTTLLGKFAGQVEFQIDKAWTIGPAVSAGFPFTWVGGALGLRTVGGGIKSHYYLAENVLTDSFYIGNELAVSTIWIETEKAKAKSYHWEFLDVGGEFGYRWNFTTGFNLSAGLGLNYSGKIGGSKDLDMLFGKIVVQPSIQLELGYVL